MPLSGDGPAKLRELIKGLQAMTDEKFRQQMNQSLGAEALALVKRGFDTSTDPYGKSWERVKRGGLPLRKTGILRNAWTYRGTGVQMEIENSLQYAAMMNFGTAGLPGGKLVPRNKKALSFVMPGAGRTRIVRGRKGRFAGVSVRNRTTVKSVVIASRKMIPADGELPEQWEARLRATAEKVVELTMKARGL